MSEPGLPTQAGARAQADRPGAPPADASDAELVKQLREGNTMAFEMLMKRYGRPIYGFIRRQVGDRGRAEDLYQETFLKVYSKIDSCRDPDAFKPWAFAIASNICKNEARRAGVRARDVRERSAAPNGQPSAGPSPESAAISAETWRRIERALASLPDAQREVFIMYQYSRLSYEEIARALEVPVGTVKSRMNAALTQLRGELAALRGA
jgi:RNA polymerase sigma-70 factor (ECF subfamily)